jgi:hypothetical protein
MTVTILSKRCFFAAAALSVGFLCLADDEEAGLPAGPGKPALIKVCGECHGYSNIRKQRLNKDDWDAKVSEMVERGAKGSDQEMAAILDYLVTQFGPDSKIWMNTAPFGELKGILKLTNEEGDAIVAWRAKNGAFKEFADVLKVPAVDAKKLEAAKEKMAF